MDDLSILQLQENIIKVLQEYLDFLGSDPERGACDFLKIKIRQANQG
jgi:hypothetical protein